MSWQLEGPSTGQSFQGSLGLKEKCKPDYEGMVSRAKEQQALSINLIDALENYIEKGDCVVDRSKLRELYGHIYFQHREYRRTIESIIKTQEEDK